MADREETSVTYFKNWLSSEGPKVPVDWGLDTFRGRIFEMKCQQCGRHLKLRDQYLYRYTKKGTEILHNKKDCYEGFISRPR